MIRRSNLKKRILIIIAGLFILILSFYFYNITKTKQIVLNSGYETKVKVIKISYGKGTIKSIYVKFNNKEYKAGEAFGPYKNVSIGDSIYILYKPGIDNVILKGKKSYLNTIIFEIIIITFGVFFILVGIFYKNNICKSELNRISNRKTKKVKIETIKEQIVLAYRKDKHKIKEEIQGLLNNSDCRVETIFDALIENKCLSNHEFISSFRHILQLYIQNQRQEYLDVLKVFLSSAQVENNEIKIIIRNLIELSKGFDANIKKELLSLLEE